MLYKPGFPAVFSEERGYRYVLWRDTGITTSYPGYLNFVCLNPSTADERVNDPTMRRVIGYAKFWGYSYVAMTNLFAFRSTKRENLARAIDPIGPENDFWLKEVAHRADTVVFGWGNHGALKNRANQVIRLLDDFRDKLYVLGWSQSRHPLHPLYLPKDLVPRKFFYAQ